MIRIVSATTAEWSSCSQPSSTWTRPADEIDGHVPAAYAARREARGRTRKTRCGVTLTAKTMPTANAIVYAMDAGIANVSG